MRAVRTCFHFPQLTPPSLPTPDSRPRSAAEARVGTLKAVTRPNASMHVTGAATMGLHALISRTRERFALALLVEAAIELRLLQTNQQHERLLVG